jgi:hypothetical protein
MYATQNKRNFTMISDLPELHELESNEGTNNESNHMGSGHNTQFQNNIPPDMAEKYSKYIRAGMQQPRPESGMSPYNQNQQYQQQQYQQQQYQQQQYQHQQEQPEFFTPPQRKDSIRPAAGSPTCLEIADHVGSCPICSRFYKNDNTVYIIAIVILSIICILLLKRVLNL